MANVVVEEVEVRQQRRRRLPRRQHRPQSLFKAGAVRNLASLTIIIIIFVAEAISSVHPASAAGWTEETKGIEMNESTFYPNFVTLDSNGRSHAKEEEEEIAVMDAKTKKVSELTKAKATAAKTNKIVKGSYHGHGYTTAAPSAAHVGKTGKGEHPLPHHLQSQSPTTPKTDRIIPLWPHLLKCKKAKAAKMLPPPPPPPRPPPPLRYLLSPYYSNNDKQGEKEQQSKSSREGGGDVIDGGGDMIDSTTGEEIKVVVDKYEREQEDHVEIITPVYYINNKTDSVVAVEKEIMDDEPTTTTTTTTTVTVEEDEEYDYICDKNGQLLTNITTYDENGQVSFPEITTYVPTISPPSEEDTTTTTTTDNNDNGSSTTDDTDEPTDGGISPGCSTWNKYTLGVNNVYYETNISAIVDFTYEILIQQDSSSIDDIVTGMMEDRLALLIGRELINCVDNDAQRSRRGLVVERQEQQLLQQQQLGGGHRRLYVDGLVSTPMDEVVPDAKCEVISSTTNSTLCYVVNSKITIYLRENDAATSIYQSTSDALKVIQTAMNDMNPSPFVEASDDTDLSIMGVQSVRYIRGTPDEGMNYISTGNGNIDEDSSVNAITKAAGELGPLSTAGIALVAIGSVAMLGVLIGLLVTAISKKRKKQKAEGEGKRDGDDSPSNSYKGRSGKRSPRSGLSTPHTYTEFFGEDDTEEDDDISLNMRQRPEDMSALPASSSANVFNSLCVGSRKKPVTQSPNSDNQSVPSDEDSNSLFSGLETGGGTSTIDGDRTVMTNRDILSVYNRDDNRSLAMTVEQGYEVKFRPSDGGVDDDVSFWRLPPTSKYEPKVKLISPRYVNPARLKASPSRKSQFVGDTVDF